MKRVTAGIVIAAIVFGSGCTLSWKPDVSASTLAQHSNPKTVVDLKNKRIEISTEANGTLNIDDASLNKDGTWHLKGNATFNSNPTTVVDAEGRRVPAAVLGASQLAMMEMAVKLDAGLTERHRLVGENMKAAGQMVALAAVGGGSAIKSVMDGVAPVLAGSAASLDLSKMIGTVSVGQPAPPIAVQPPVKEIP